MPPSCDFLSQASRGVPHPALAASPFSLSETGVGLMSLPCMHIGRGEPVGFHVAGAGVGVRLCGGQTSVRILIFLMIQLFILPVIWLLLI